jgi:tetratricopeptide (TPR) repeat protein
MVLLAAGLGLSAWLCLLLLRPVPPPEGFPNRPDLASANLALVRLIEDAEMRARDNPNSAAEVGRLGLAYHANEFYAQAEKAYSLASRLDRGDYRWPYYHAVLKEEQGQEQAQLELLLKVLELKPDYVPALQKLGDIFSKRDNLSEAARYFERCLEAAGADGAPQAVFALGRIAERHRDWPRVIELLTPLAQSHPHFRPVHQLLADAYQALGKSDQAAENRAGLLQPNLTPVPPLEDPLYEELVAQSCSSTRLLKEAGLLSRFGKQEAAVRIARRAVEAVPEDADVHHFLAQKLLDFRGGDPAAIAEALGHLREGLRLRPSDLLPLYYFATFFFKERKTEAAVEELRMMLAEKGKGAEGSYYLGVVAGRQGRSQEAAAHYREALRRDPNYAEPHQKLGLILLKEGRFNDAEAHFRKAVGLKPSFTRARCDLGVALEQQGRMNEAVVQYEEALRLKPNDLDAQMAVAIALLKLGKTQTATLHFRNAVRIAPGDPEAHYGLGFALARQQKGAEAATELREALRLRPGYAEARDLLELLERDPRAGLSR